MKLCNTKYFVSIHIKISRILLALAAMALILSLPVAGGLWAGLPTTVWTEFPPRTRVVCHAAFDWRAFAVLAAFIATVVAALVWRVARTTRITSELSVERSVFSVQTITSQRKITPAFPLWGWAGAGWLLGAWVIAWTRLPALAWMQHHT